MELVSALIYSKIPLKYNNPGCPIISCVINQYNIEKILLDFGVGINLLPYWVYKQVGLEELKTIPVILQLTNKSERYP